MEKEASRKRGRPAAPSEHSLGSYLRALRTNRRMTVRDVARAVGLPESSAGYISQLEKGTKVPSAELAEQLAAKLGDQRGVFRLWAMVSRRSDPSVASSARRELARLLNDPTLIQDARFIPASYARIYEGAAVAFPKRSGFFNSAFATESPRFRLGSEFESSSEAVSSMSVRRPESPDATSVHQWSLSPREDPPAHSVPLLEEGQDPDRGTTGPPQYEGYVRLDPRTALAVPLVRPFAYRLSEEGVHRVKHLLRADDIAVITRDNGPIVRHELYAVRLDDQVVLSGLIWNRHQLLLLPAADENDFVVLEVPEGRWINDLVLGHVATVIRGGEREEI